MLRPSSVFLFHGSPLSFVSFTAHTDENLAPREGWAVLKTDKDFQTLVKDTRTAVKAQSLIVVTQAGPTAAAKKLGITIPGNRVIGVFNNDLAGNVLETSTAAMIEAPHSPLRHRKLGRLEPSLTKPLQQPSPRISLRAAHLLLQSLLNSIKFFNTSQKLQAPKTQSSL